ESDAPVLEARRGAGFRADVIDFVSRIARRRIDDTGRDKVGVRDKTVIPIQPADAICNGGKPGRTTQTETAHQTVTRGIVHTVANTHDSFLINCPGETGAWPNRGIINVAETRLAITASAIPQICQCPFQP